MANTKNDARKVAREYYLTTDMTQEEIARACKVNPATIRQWKLADSWDMLKAATNITPRKTIAGYLLQLENLRQQIDKRPAGENFPNSKESDIIMKVSKSIKMLQRSLTISDYINAFEDLTKFGLNLDADLTKQFAGIMNEFIQVKAKELRDA